MKKGTKVKWLLPHTSVPGRGTVLSDPDESGHVLVAVDSFGHEPPAQLRPVVYCDAELLTDASKLEAPAPMPPGQRAEHQDNGAVSIFSAGICK